MEEFKDQKVVVTGGSRGIGRAIVEGLALKGASLLFVYQKSDRLAEDLCRDLRAKGCKVWSLRGDLAEGSAVENLFAEVASRWGTLDLLVHNAGWAHFSPFDLVEEGEWRRMIDVHLTAAYRLCRRAIPLMVANKRGKILLIGSIWGTLGASCEVSYSAAKGGLLTLTRALARELAPSNIQVNMISPGVIATEMNAFLTAEEGEELVAEIPRGRFGTPKDVASWVVYLAGSGGDYLTGQNITVDGGYSLAYLG